MSEQKEKRQYTREFKREAVRLNEARNRCVPSSRNKGSRPTCCRSECNNFGHKRQQPFLVKGSCPKRRLNWPAFSSSRFSS